MIARASKLGLGSESELKKMGDAQLVALLKENDPEFTEPAPKASPAADKDMGDDPRTGRKLRVRIEMGHEAQEKGPVYGCVNGFDFYAPRAKEVEMDEGFVEHLRSQYVTESMAVLDDKGHPTGEVVETDRPRFQVTILGPAE